jgi:hypothetical protein
MLYAIDSQGKKVKAEPKKVGFCGLCDKQLLPKCGSIITWHWAHKDLSDCDTWAEGETEWHLEWKKQFDKENCEVKIGNHRADIKSKSLIVELQNKSISSEEIAERELFYGNMIWIFNEIDCAGLDIRGNCETGNYVDGYATIRWKHPPKTLWNIKKLLFLDVGNGKVFYLKKIYPNIPCGGYGYILDKEYFINCIKTDTPPQFTGRL